MKMAAIIAAEEHVRDLNAARLEIARLEASLLQSKRELLEYAHIASHDLQEPLRKIQIYSGMLRDRKSLETQDKDFLEKIWQSSQRMSLLLTDMVAHSNATGKAKIFRPVSLNEVVATILSDFELAIIEKGAVISIDPLPEVNASPLEMNNLFFNLIDNALKFSDDSRQPEIAIRCKRMTEQTISEYIPLPVADKKYYDISIRDNGIGFNVKYAEQIVKVFSKLHHKETYPGSGIGLPICRSIVASHGGALFAESRPGEGSAFHIIIPE